MAKRISDAEWEVLQVLWDCGEAGANEIVSRLRLATDWKPTTIKTLLSRLVKKEVVGYQPQPQGYVYFPLVSESECAARERRSLLEKVYRGDRRSMLTAFLAEERLSEDDIEALRQLLDDGGAHS
jgi:BlaI family penicillinase repressor